MNDRTVPYSSLEGTTGVTSDAVPAGIDVQQHDVPAEIADLVPDADYVDLFVATAPGAAERSPEQWARAAIEGARWSGRYLAWELVLRLRLDLSPSPERIEGWQVVERGASWITLRASSWFMTAHMVFLVRDDLVTFATFVRYDRPVARRVWTAVSVVHRAVAPDFLRGAVVRIRRESHAR